MSITRLGTYPQIKGSPYKIPCRVATDTDVTLTGGTPNQVDGINLSVGDRILVKSQSTTSQNGIYYVEILGSGSNGTWVRSVDLSINDDIFQGVTIFVSEGTLYGGTLFVINTPNPIDLGTTSYGFDIAFSGGTGSSGLSGLEGISGISGLEGISGISGIEGISGLEGLSGISGLEGNSGISGLEGISGISGLEGVSGISGLVGNSGISGISGLQGISGISGLEGVSGISGLQGVSGIGFSAVTNFSDNRILTSDGTANAANAEPNLTFDGTTLNITGQTTQQYSGPNAFTITGTYTTTANSQAFTLINPSITQRNTASESTFGVSLTPTLVGTANAQELVGLNISPTYTTFGSTTNISRRVALKVEGAYLGTINGSNLVFGFNNGRHISTAFNNTFVGNNTGVNLQNGYYNTGFGDGIVNIGGTGGALNVSVGYGAGSGNYGTNANVVIGAEANRDGGAFPYSSGNNVFIGYRSGFTNGNNNGTCVHVGASTVGFANTDSNAIAIGYGTYSQGSNTAVFGNNSITRTLLKGDVGLGYTPTNLAVTLDGRLDVVGSSSVTGNALKVANSTPTTLFVVQNVGNVGIGPTSPTSKLHVSGTTNIATFVGSGGTLYFDGTTLNFSGSSNANFQDNLLVRPEMKDYSETYSSPSIVSSALTLNLESGNVFNVTLNSNVSTLTISNPPASGKTASFTLVLTADGTARTITWGGSVKWAGGSGPTLTSTNGKVDILSFMSLDGGTNWYGFIAGQDF